MANTFELVRSIYSHSYVQCCTFSKQIEHTTVLIMTLLAWYAYWMLIIEAANAGRSQLPTGCERIWHSNERTRFRVIKCITAHTKATHKKKQEGRYTCATPKTPMLNFKAELVVCDTNQTLKVKHHFTNYLSTVHCEGCRRTEQWQGMNQLYRSFELNDFFFLLSSVHCGHMFTFRTTPKKTYKAGRERCE